MDPTTPDLHTDEVLRKADALIRRHRVFIAGAPQNAYDDDVPVLTEVVGEPEARQATRAQAPFHMQPHLDALREELARWLSEELPHVVLRVTDGLADRLMGELTHQAEQHLLPRLIARLDGNPSPGDDVESRR
ncbi:MAG TPA: hypothetical protein VJ001_03615 [Rhodocyclaceae bacterium]|nr:hypothetical protein [Rhodocyclaceae bacterium]